MNRTYALCKKAHRKNVVFDICISCEYSVKNKNFQDQKIHFCNKDTWKSLKSFFNYTLQKSNMIRNSKGWWQHIFRNMPLGSTNSFVKNIFKKSVKIVKSPHTIRWLIIFLWLSCTNLANACIFKNWEHSELTQNSNSSS